jgi:D-alanyl-D-alanine carboxypeptidase/D-alanyl-D-alanine-endopeptidase (penicillin-binding protein 4)
MQTLRLLAAFCILHSALAGCAKRPPATPAPSPPPVIDPVQHLRSDVDALIDRAGHQHGIWGIVVESLTRGDRLYERNARTLLVPASTMKLVSVAAAAEAAGWDYTFETELLAAGAIEGGVLRGDLLIVGSGDPSVLGRPGEDSFEPWIDALRQRGISRVDGRVVADDNRTEEPKPGFGWSWEDLGYTYGAIPGALNLAENSLDILVSPGSAPGLPTVIELPADARDVPVVNASVTADPDAAGRLWPELRPGSPAIVIHGAIAAGAPPVVVSVAAGDPTLWFARAVRNRLLAAGIDVTGEAADADDLLDAPLRDGAALVYTRRSPPLSAIAESLLEESINLYAESVLRLATGREGPRTIDAGLDAVRLRLQAWGIPPEEIQIVDGSGLSRRNVIAPAALLTILRRFHDPSGESPWMRALPVAGRDGTLASRMTGTAAEGNAAAKSGSMSNIRSLAGYVRTADGEPVAFAIMANNFEGPASGVVATVDALVARLAVFSRASQR